MNSALLLPQAHRSPLATLCSGVAMCRSLQRANRRTAERSERGFGRRERVFLPSCCGLMGIY